MPDETIDFECIDGYAIYPPIGLVRVGNSEEPNINDGWFYAPEVPGRFDEPPGGYKDQYGKVKRQAARFRVYALSNGVAKHEVTNKNGFDIRWTVQLANKKASWYKFLGRYEGQFKPGYRSLRNPDVQAENDPNERNRLIIRTDVVQIDPDNEHKVLEGTFEGTDGLINPPTVYKKTKVYLGEARSDDQGRLVILGGRGLSRNILDPENPLISDDFNTPGWIDDTSDGWITAQVRYDGGNWEDVPTKARVLVGPPDYARGVYQPTTLYDLIEEVYEQKKRAEAKDQGTEYDVGEVKWYEHIWPLLQRPPLLSWVNIQATGGHGPGGPGNFFDENWLKALKSKDPNDDAIKQGVLGRMRLPWTNPEYDGARFGQAYPYFMPWLSGDGGRTTSGDPTSFASITELQYDRLVKWAKRDFTIDTPPILNFDDIPKKDQPAALTKAALDPTIGAPLYPGLEASWNMEEKTTYNFETPFAIDPYIEAGDLTRFLSLPWQSDFYLCRNYWWPAVRPDAVLPEDTYKQILFQNQNLRLSPANLAKLFVKETRRPWERGIRPNYTDEFPVQPYYANSDMVKKWHLLGIIAQRDGKNYVTETEQPIFIETARSASINPAPVLSLPDPPQRRLHVPLRFPEFPENGEIRTLEELHEHLQTAIQVELSTIPIYLYAMYSVKTPARFTSDPRYYNPLTAAVRGVVAEEMLHLSLAGNILVATGGNPILYDPYRIPTYPSDMLGHADPPVSLNLRKLDKENLKSFLQIEKPAQPNAQAEPDKYHTLAQFYKAIQDGLVLLNDTIGEQNLFPQGKDEYQFHPGRGYQPHWLDAGGSVVIRNLGDAEKAIKIIVEQGEGFEYKDPYDDKDRLEKSHYEIFSEIYWSEDNDLLNPDNLWNVLDNPRKGSYRDPKLKQVATTFNAAYSFLLLTIQTLWRVPTSDDRHKFILQNLYGLMMGVLAPLARYMVQQEVGGGRHAGPTFEYYPFDDGPNAPSPLKQLQAEMERSINIYLDDDRDETPDQVSRHKFGEKVNELIPIQTAIQNLAELI